MDCVSDSGDVFIGYAATVRWKTFSINYSSILEQQYGEPTQIHTSLKKSSAPEISGSSLEWASDTLGVEGSWQAIAPPIEHAIFESEMGDIKWRCIAPIARAEVHTESQPRLEGLGYAEHISVSVPPWRLPLDELRWGRFLSDCHHLTWIDWRGPHPLTLVFHNRAAIEGAKVADDEVIVADGELTISVSGRRVLREGVLVSTALAAIPGIQKVIPSRILNAHESKWCSRGVFRKPGESDVAGWVIHEVVRWGQ